MTLLTIPTEGLTLVHGKEAQYKEHDAKEPHHIVCLDLVDADRRDILKTLTNGEKASIRLGKRPLLKLAKRSLELEDNHRAYASELFSATENDSSTLKSVTSTNMSLEPQRAQEVVERTDVALAELQNTLKSMQDHKATQESTLLRGREELRKLNKSDNRPSPLMSAVRKDRFGDSTPKSIPGSPFLNASFPSHQAPTSTPLLGSAMTAKDQLRLEAIKVPALHLLAAGPMGMDDLCAKLRAPRDDCQKVIDKIARDINGKKELKDKSYRELDVWKFPYQNKDRQAAIEHAIHVYDRMRVEKTDPIWQLLLPVVERDKGRILSKLNFDKPHPKPATPRPSPEDSNEGRSVTSEKEQVNAKPKTKSGAGKVAKESVHERRISNVSKASSSSASSQDRITNRTGAIKAKQEGKFKSSEIIEDSDEEAEAAAQVVAKTEEAASTRVKVQTSSVDKPHVPRSAQKSPLKKSANTHTPLHRQPAVKSHKETIERSRSPATKSLRPPSKPEVSSKFSPRPRTDSSPQKPSPLGSSPPTNSTDVETSSSEKASSRSSATSSPPSSTDMARTRGGNTYSPVIQERPRQGQRGRSPPRKRSLENEEPSPAKRQKLPANGMLHDKRPDPPKCTKSDTKHSDSGESDSPVVSRDDVVDRARKFRQYYDRYKTNFEKLNSVPEEQRDESEMEKLWTMHSRLEAMKEDLWRDWPKVATEEEKKAT